MKEADVRATATSASSPQITPTRRGHRPRTGRRNGGANRTAHLAWALLFARIYAVFPLLCTICGGDMRIIAFFVDTAIVRDILADLGEPPARPKIAPARGPPLWEAAGTDHHPSAGPVPKLARDFEFDERLIC